MTRGVARDAELRQRAVELYASGMSSPKVAAACGTDASSVRKWARDADVEIRASSARRPVPLHADEIKRAVALYSGTPGMPVKQIARELGRRQERVRDALVEAGLPIRGPSGGDGRRRFSDEDKNAAVVMYASGASSVAVAAKVGTTSATVLKWVRSAGGTIHPQGGRADERRIWSPQFRRAYASARRDAYEALRSAHPDEWSRLHHEAKERHGITSTREPEHPWGNRSHGGRGEE